MHVQEARNGGSIALSSRGQQMQMHMQMTLATAPCMRQDVVNTAIFPMVTRWLCLVQFS